MTTIGWLFVLGAIWLFRAAGRGQIFDQSGNFVLLDNLEKIVTALITNDSKALAEADKPGAFGIFAPTPKPTLETVDRNEDNYREGGNAALPKVWASNPNTVEQAIAYCEKQTQSGLPIWYRRCLAFCARAYGLVGSGTWYAIDIWSQVPKEMRHTGKVNIPTGALLLYRNGSRAGHIAIYAGNGMVYSTDIKRRGRVDKVRFTDLVGGTWNLDYVGWTPPYFPRNPNSKRVST